MTERILSWFDFGYVWFDYCCCNFPYYPFAFSRSHNLPFSVALICLVPLPQVKKGKQTVTWSTKISIYAVRAHKNPIRTITVDEAKHTELAMCACWGDKHRYIPKKKSRTEPCYDGGGWDQEPRFEPTQNRTRKPDWKLWFARMSVCVMAHRVLDEWTNERMNETTGIETGRTDRDRARWSVCCMSVCVKRRQHTHTHTQMSIIFVITKHVRCNRIKYIRADYDGKKWIATAESGWTKGDGKSKYDTHSAPIRCFCTQTHTHVCDTKDIKCCCFCDCFRTQNKFIKANLMSGNFSNMSLYLTVCSWRFMVRTHLCGDTNVCLYSMRMCDCMYQSAFQSARLCN